jgi:hypothetical protein
MNQKYKHIISLGRLCAPRMIVDHFKIREKYPIRMPFDGSYHKYDFVCEMIKNNFKGYLDNATLIDKPKLMWTKKVAYWNHENGSDFEELKENSRLRIEQFISTLSLKESVLFILNKPDKQHNFDIDELINAFKLNFKNLNFHILHFNSGAPDYLFKKMEYSSYLNKPFDGDINAKLFLKENASYLNEMLIELCKVLEEDPKKYQK